MPWANMTKNRMYGLHRVQYCAARAVTQFNLGAVAAEVEGIGNPGKVVAERRNAKRKLNMNIKEERKEDQRNKRMKQLNKEARKRTEEGVTYQSGGCDEPAESDDEPAEIRSDDERVME